MHQPGTQFLSEDEARKALMGGAENVAVLKYGTIEKIEGDGESRRVRFVFSDGSVDRHNDTIDPNGWRLDEFLKNPVILWSHDHGTLPIGKAVDVSIESGKLMGSIEFADHPLATMVERLITGGFLRAVSVGFRPLKWSFNEERDGIDFEEQELLETSVVSVPANPRALIAASAAGVDLEPLRQWIAKTILAWPGDLRMPGKVWNKLLDEDEDASDQPDTAPECVISPIGATIERMPEEPITISTDDGGDEPLVLVLADEPERYTVDTDNLDAALRSAVQQGIAQSFREHADNALRYMRGRV